VKPDPSWFDNEDPEVLLTADLPSRARPSPDGKWVAEVGRDGRMTLRDAAGAEQWIVSAGGASDVVWNARGELVAYGDGIARVDLATGAWLERQCGWWFGLWDYDDDRADAMSSLMCEGP